MAQLFQIGTFRMSVPYQQSFNKVKDSFMADSGFLTIGKVVKKLQTLYPDLSVSKVRYLRDRRFAPLLPELLVVMVSIP